MDATHDPVESELSVEDLGRRARADELYREAREVRFIDYSRVQELA